MIRQQLQVGDDNKHTTTNGHTIIYADAGNIYLVTIHFADKNFRDCYKS